MTTIADTQFTRPLSRMQCQGMGCNVRLGGLEDQSPIVGFQGQSPCGGLCVKPPEALGTM